MGRTIENANRKLGKPPAGLRREGSPGGWEENLPAGNRGAPGLGQRRLILTFFGDDVLPTSSLATILIALRPFMIPAVKLHFAAPIFFGFEGQTIR